MSLDATTPSPETPIEFGPEIGYFMDGLIYAWLRMVDGIYTFDGIAPGPRPGHVDMSKIGPDEICVSPGLRYKKEH